MNYSLLYSILLLLPLQLLCMNAQEFDKMLSDFKKFGQDTGFSLQQPAPIVSELQPSNTPAEQPLAGQSQEVTIPPHLISVFFLAGSKAKTPLVANRIKSEQQNGEASSCFTCRLGCGKALATLSGIRRHEQRDHSDTLPYQCAICNRRFFNSLGLHQHTQKAHSVSQNN